MTVSKLAKGCILSPNYTQGRYEVSRLTPHHTAMIGTAEQIAAVFKPESREASCNYAIGVDGGIVCVVLEENRSWCTASYENDMRAITFELSDCDYDWNISDATLESYINLCVDLIQRYPSLGGSYNWTGDTSGNVTLHRWFASTACPADPLANMQDWLMSEINRRLDGRYGIPMECILHPDECGTLFYVCGQDITPLGCPDNMNAVDMLAEKCGTSVPHVEFGTKAAPWGWRFFQACGKGDLYNEYVLGAADPFDGAADEPQPEPEPVGTRIMGESLTTVPQMAACFEDKGKPYPEIYAEKGAPTIEDFCAILLDEAEAEGVRAEVVFSQAMHETGWLQFGGDVQPDQCNFAGIGATGGVPGNSFEDVRQGLRAQVQHLKAYASTDDLANECVDPRFHYIERGIAPTVEELGGKWAVGSHYGERIIAIVDYVLGMEIAEPEPEPERAEKLRYCIDVLTEMLEECE